jgi:hypothetical protein
MSVLNRGYRTADKKYYYKNQIHTPNVQESGKEKKKKENLSDGKFLYVFNLF